MGPGSAGGKGGRARPPVGEHNLANQSQTAKLPSWGCAANHCAGGTVEFPGGDSTGDFQAATCM